MRARLAKAIVLTAVVSACTSGAASSSALPPPPSILPVTMTEYHFEHPPTMPLGRVIFQVRNAGQLQHKLEMVRLPDDFQGTLDQQLHSSTRRPVAGRASLAPQSSGDVETFAVDLTPGKYGFICFVQDPDGRSHADKGMSSDFDVQ